MSWKIRTSQWLPGELVCLCQFLRWKIFSCFWILFQLRDLPRMVKDHQDPLSHLTVFNICFRSKIRILVCRGGNQDHKSSVTKSRMNQFQLCAKIILNGALWLDDLNYDKDDRNPNIIPPPPPVTHHHYHHTTAVCKFNLPTLFIIGKLLKKILEDA